jgi:multidrug efflux system membrane fusion protein
LSFSVDAYPGETFDARVIAIDPQIGADTRSIALQARLENPEQRLMPGMFADARLALAPRTGVLVVPETAVDYTIHGDSVFRVVDGDQLRVERVLVQTGERYDGQVAIVQGLAPGDRVVIAGQLNLQDGVGVVLAPSDTLDAARAKARQARP